jgi:hypothetical protein
MQTSRSAPERSVAGDRDQGWDLDWDSDWDWDWDSHCDRDWDSDWNWDWDSHCDRDWDSDWNCRLGLGLKGMIPQWDISSTRRSHPRSPAASS